MTFVSVLPEPAVGAGLMPFDLTAADRALGPLRPHLGTLFNARYLRGRGVRNMAAPDSGLLPVSGAASVVTAAIGSEPAVDVQTSTTYRLLSGAAINPAEWTLFFVLAFTSAGTPGSRDILRAETAPTSGYCPRVVLSASDALNLHQNGSSTVRLSAGVQASATPAVYAITLSEEQGLAIWKNGARVAHAPNDSAPFDAGFGAGEWCWGRLNDGSGYLRLGWAGHCNIDISRWRYSAAGQAGHMARITAYLKALYGIA